MGEFNQQKYINQYNNEKYDTIRFLVPKGGKATIDDYRKSRGYKSMNAYVNDVIRKDMEEHGQSMEQNERSVQGGVFVILKMPLGLGITKPRPRRDLRHRHRGRGLVMPGTDNHLTRDRPS